MYDPTFKGAQASAEALAASGSIRRFSDLGIRREVLFDFVRVVDGGATCFGPIAVNRQNVKDAR